MLASRFKVVLDANVLFPFSLRDVLLRAAEDEFYQLYWSAEILDEARRNLVAKEVMSEKKAQILQDALLDAFPEALIEDYEHLVEAMQNDEKDRHVAAAAVKAGAEVIVTENLKDFTDLPAGIEAQSSDEFLCNLLDLDPDRMIRLVQEAAATLQKPPIEFAAYLDRLEQWTPRFCEGLRRSSGG